MGTIPTRRERNGWIAFGTIILLFLFLVLLEVTHDQINHALNIMDFFTWRIVMSDWRMYLLTSIGMILIILSALWSYRNQIHKGLKQALIRWKLTKQLRKAIHHAKYDTTLTHNNTTYALLPEIKIIFDNNTLDTGQIWIRSSTRDNVRLAKVDITPDLKGYKVEQNYISEDGDWYIYYIYSVSSQIQSEFNTLEEFVYWATKDTDNYQLKIDNRFTTDLTHAEIVGATRSGKTFALLSLLLQIVNKDINYDLYFADPKNADFKNYGNYIAQNRVAVEDDDICRIIDLVHRKMMARQKDMNKKLKEKATADYRSFNYDPIILMFDEYPSWYDSMNENKNKISKKNFETAESQLKRISQMGAGSGVFLILIFQKLDAKTLPKSIQSNMLLKIVLGNADNQTYMTAIDRAEDVPNYNFGLGQGIYKNERMIKPKLLGFPNLKFIEEFNENPNKSPKDMFKKLKKAQVNNYEK